MEDLALSLDRQNAEDLMRPPAPALPGRQVGQLIKDTEQHAPLPVQVSDADDEPSPPIQASEQDLGNSDPTDSSFEHTIRKYMPENSDLAISLEKRHTFACIVEDDDLKKSTYAQSSLNDINDFLALAEGPEKPTLLIIQDANIHWSKALCARYPNILSPELLAAHVIHFDEIPIVKSTDGKPESIESYLNRSYPEAGFSVSWSGDFMSIGMKGILRTKKDQFNLDFVVELHHGEASAHAGVFYERSMFRRRLDKCSDVFKRDEQHNWKRISGRLSCFRLATDLHMVLVKSTPRPQGLFWGNNWPIEKYMSRTMQIRSPFIGDLRLFLNPDGESDAAMDHIVAPFIDAFEGHGHTLQSIFDPQRLPTQKFEGASQRGWRRAQILFWLLAETSWRRMVAHLESRLHELQREATTIAGDQTFERLTGFRRVLAEAYGMLAEAQRLANLELKDESLFWDVGGKRVSAEAFWSEERVQSKAVGVMKARSIDIRDLPKMLEELLERIQAMTHAVNGEIQMVIGSVQVEDARVTKRQTEWTVVLAALATIYLPMTLVTGIFGMNITEIDAGGTAPDAWSVVKAWGVVFGITIGSVLTYAVVRVILRYRRVCRMLLGRKMRKIGDGSLHRKLLALKLRVHKLPFYWDIAYYRRQMKRWDEEAQMEEKTE